jgi:predicted amidohydrolase
LGDGRITIACVQHCAGLDVDANLRMLARLIEQAVARGAQAVCLSEYCAAYGMTNGRLAVGAKPKATTMRCHFSLSRRADTSVGY